MKISYFANPALDPAKHFLVRIALYHPRFLKKKIDATVLELAPTRELLDLGKSGMLKTYKRHYLKQLEAIGLNRVLEIIAQLKAQAGKRELVFLCYEKPEDYADSLFYCHRQLFAEWYESKTNVAITEL